MSNAVVWCRVSSREQKETGYSLPAQEKYLCAYAGKLNLETSVFSCAESASAKKVRTEFKIMLKFVIDHKISIIICEKVDRLTRSFKDLVVINDWLNGDTERQIHFVKENTILRKDSLSHEKLMWNMKVVMAQFYIDNLTEEVKKGQMQKILEGWSPATPPLGYKSVHIDGKSIHVIDPDTAPLVKKMFKLYATGNYSVDRLCDVVAKDGLRSKKGYKLVPSRIHHYLTNPYYFGLFNWNGEKHLGNYEPLITKDTFLLIQKILKGKTTPKLSKHFFPFRGLFKCRECQGTITWETQKGIVYGHCNHYKKCTQKKWVKERELEKELLKHLQLLQLQNKKIASWIRKAIAESVKTQIEVDESAIQKLQNNLSRIKSQLSNLLDLRTSDEITKDEYVTKKSKYAQEQDQLETSLAKHQQQTTKYSELGLHFFDLSQRAEELYETLSPEKKRQLIHLIFATLEVDNGVILFSYTKPFQILAEAVKVTNSSKVLKNEEIVKKTFEPTERIDNSIQRSILLDTQSVLSGKQDSNLRPHGPKPCALAI